ncbi:hypothetical protein AN217_11850 [Streptomyces qinglanensis]|uniref:Clumping factor B n=1 Tax=Streptomyces qinglanensis TaxID=943816 RepID=A0A1E7K387_9ACTN|nr:DUF485 domain-containing protein [Streptomyces sp. GKU 257-1]OEU98391.1 hypothetical protein AN217_11850 [Streptomyces qinglanensis]OEV26435.1 hypothetical protein AN220_08015 [Streptomyces nanshensis]
MDTAPEHAHPGPPGPRDYTDVQHSAEFGELRRGYRSFVFPLTVGFIVWYLLYVLLSNYAGGFMSTEVVGNVNVAFVFGLAQFLTTFLIAWWYSRFAAVKLDPKAEALKTRLEAENLQRATGAEIGHQAAPRDEDKGQLAGQEDDA